VVAINTPGRNTTRRDRHRRAIARSKPDCAICGDEIDYKADWLDPLSFTVDHIQPLNKGGADALANKQAAHRRPANATEPSQT